MVGLDGCGDVFAVVGLELDGGGSGGSVLACGRVGVGCGWWCVRLGMELDGDGGGGGC